MTNQANPSPRHALVTGAGGFIGHHLTRRLLDTGWHVTAMDLHLEALGHLGESHACRLLEGDLCDPELRTRALCGADTVFHLAAAHLGALKSVEEFRRVNVEATVALAAESLASGIRRFVHCSSVGVYGRLTTPPADEQTPCHPELPYEKTKLEGERHILDLVAQRQLPAVILRPAWVYGPDDPRTVKLVRSIAAGRFLVAGKGDTLRHCIFIDDMVTALLLASGRPVTPGEVFVIGDDEAITIRTLVDEIAALTGAPRPRSLPLPILYALAVGTEAIFRLIRREPPVSRRSLRFFTGNTAFDTGKAKKVLGFQPRFDLATGLERVIDSLVRSRSIPGSAAPPPTRRL